jgi:hypothetical protein
MYVSIFNQWEYEDLKMLQSEMRKPSILLLWFYKHIYVTSTQDSSKDPRGSF